MNKESRELTLDQAMNLGTHFARIGHHTNACTMFKGVLVHEPENFEAIQRLGSSLFELRQYYEAMWWFWRGLKLDRKNPMANTNYGLCLGQLGHPEEGLPYLERAAANAERFGTTKTALALAYNNLGNTYERLDRHAEALTALEKGIEVNPIDPFPYYNRGLALIRLNRFEEGVTSLKTSLAMAGPADDYGSRLNEADTRYNLGCAELMLGRYKDGFANYEFRLLTSESDVATPKHVDNLGLPAANKWNGAHLDGKTVLVHGEQGIGDSLQFLRFLPEFIATKRPSQVLLIVHKAVQGLAEIPGVHLLPSQGMRIEDHAIHQMKDDGEAGDLIATYDCWVPLMSLPLHLDVDANALPQPYQFRVDTERQNHWAEQLGIADPRLKVGVCWAGNFQHKNDAHRSIPFCTFTRALDVPSCQFVSLQQVRPNEEDAVIEWTEAHENFHNLHLTDLRDTAAIISLLDLVVTVDTSVAHLAASLGVETWILLPDYATDWRWMRDRTDSPWYPSARLYRERRPKDWPFVLDRVRGDLERLSIPAAA